MAGLVRNNLAEMSLHFLSFPSFLFFIFLFPQGVAGQSQRWRIPPSTAGSVVDTRPVISPTAVPPPAPLVQPAPIPPRVRHASTGRADLDRLYEQAALRYGLDVNVLIEQGRVESINFSPAVISGRLASPAGAVGISQFIAGTARRYGLVVMPGRDDRTSPELAIDAQARYMRDLLRRFNGRYDLAIAAYNCGEHQPAFREWRIPRIAETMNYTSKILGNVQRAVRRPPVGFFSPISVLPEKKDEALTPIRRFSERFLH